MSVSKHFVRAQRSFSAAHSASGLFMLNFSRSFSQRSTILKAVLPRTFSLPRTPGQLNSRALSSSPDVFRVTMENFDVKVMREKNTPVILDFHALYASSMYPFNPVLQMVYSVPIFGPGLGGDSEPVQWQSECLPWLKLRMRKFTSG
jgi:hypothetical protein